MKPLSGLKVLDFTHVLAGPFATQMLADLGADVVKVENPLQADHTRSIPPFTGDHSHYFVAINHGKRSIAIDLRSATGRETAFELAMKADVVIENFRPGVIDRMGLNYEKLAAANPRLIQCSISGFGQTGSWSKRAAYDIIVQAMSGYMSVTGEENGPPLRCGVSIGDMVSGLYAVQAICTALYERERTGRGQALDVAMFDCMVSMLTYYVTLAEISGKSPEAAGSLHATLTPVGAFQTVDGWIVIAATTEVFWRNLCRALGRDELTVDPRFVDLTARQANRSQLLLELQPLLLTRTSAEWTELLDRHDVPNGPVLDVLQLLDHPLARERKIFRPLGQEFGDLSVSRYPVLARGTPIEETLAGNPPNLGEQSSDIVRDWLGSAPD
jgi:crotonobetainyl-CoA:carnitine CoA-transferase CaiB-like acyl-CoA transferase